MTLIPSIQSTGKNSPKASHDYKGGWEKWCLPGQPFLATTVISRRRSIYLWWTASHLYYISGSIQKFLINSRDYVLFIICSCCLISYIAQRRFSVNACEMEWYFISLAPACLISNDTNTGRLSRSQINFMMSCYLFKPRNISQVPWHVSFPLPSALSTYGSPQTIAKEEKSYPLLTSRRRALLQLGKI